MKLNDEAAAIHCSSMLSFNKNRIHQCHIWASKLSLCIRGSRLIAIVIPKQRCQHRRSRIRGWRCLFSSCELISTHLVHLKLLAHLTLLTMLPHLVLLALLALSPFHTFSVWLSLALHRTDGGIYLRSLPPPEHLVVLKKLHQYRS